MTVDGELDRYMLKGMFFYEGYFALYIVDIIDRHVTVLTGGGRQRGSRGVIMQMLPTGSNEFVFVKFGRSKISFDEIDMIQKGPV